MAPVSFILPVFNFLYNLQDARQEETWKFGKHAMNQMNQEKNSNKSLECSHFPLQSANFELCINFIPRALFPSRGLCSDRWREGEVCEDWLNSAAQLYFTPDDFWPGLYILVSNKYVTQQSGYI